MYMVKRREEKDKRAGAGAAVERASRPPCCQYSNNYIDQALLALMRQRPGSARTHAYEKLGQAFHQESFLMSILYRLGAVHALLA